MVHLRGPVESWNSGEGLSSLRMPAPEAGGARTTDDGWAAPPRIPAPRATPRVAPWAARAQWMDNDATAGGAADGNDPLRSRAFGLRGALFFVGLMRGWSIGQ